MQKPEDRRNGARQNARGSNSERVNDMARVQGMEFCCMGWRERTRICITSFDNMGEQSTEHRHSTQRLCRAMPPHLHRRALCISPQLRAAIRSASVGIAKLSSSSSDAAVMATVVVAGAFTTDDATGARAKFGCGMNADASETLTMSARRARRTFPPNVDRNGRRKQAQLFVRTYWCTGCERAAGSRRESRGEQRLGDAPA